MARSSAKHGGDRVLESRHLVGLFLGVVLLCAVFFTLGYVMGRTQYGGPVHAAASPAHAPFAPATGAKPDKNKDQNAQNPAAPAPGEWDFYTKKDDARLAPAADAAPGALPKPLAVSAPAGVKTTSASPALVGPEKSAASAPAPNTASRFAPPKSAKGAIMLQIAALRHESDALAMADILQRKKFPSFVVAPSSDAFYRVQVGPYSTDRAAQIAQSSLEHDGFKALLKR